jgi:hypothetical protein
MSTSNTCTAKGCSRKVASVVKYGALPEASEFCPDCSRLVLCEPAAPTVDVQLQPALEAQLKAIGEAFGNRLLGQAAVTPEDEAELKKYFDRFTFILDPVANIDQLLIEAKAAPRFRNDTYDAVDRLDAALFTGDEFMATREIRQHFRYYLARWEKKLREYDEFDNAMDGERDGE